MIHRSNFTFEESELVKCFLTGQEISSFIGMCGLVSVIEIVFRRCLKEMGESKFLDTGKPTLHNLIEKFEKLTGSISRPEDNDNILTSLVEFHNSLTHGNLKQFVEYIESIKTFDWDTSLCTDEQKTIHWLDGMFNSLPFNLLPMFKDITLLINRLITQTNLKLKEN